MANAQNGNFVWYECLGKDTKAAIAFYSEVIGWKTQAFETGGYMMWVGKEGPMGGIMKLPDPAAKMGAPPHWMGHVLVASVDATVTQAKKLGAKVHVEPQDIPTVGRFAVIADPQGASLSVFTPNKPMPLHNLENEGEVCWNELLTSDSAAAFKFYQELFGWKMIQEMEMGPMGVYRIFGVGDKGMGGMMTTPKGNPAPPSWLYYFQTRDLDAAMARAQKQGAKVLNGPMEVPGGARIAQMMDPQGCAFALHASLKK
jgi:predicted enzyme related to lactoylglutathione lyase